MTLLKYLLSALFSMIAIYILIQISVDKNTSYGFVICCACICMTASLNRLGGKVIMVLSYFSSGIFSLFLLGVIVSIAIPLFGGKFDLTLFLICLLFGVAGVLTSFIIKKEIAKNI